MNARRAPRPRNGRRNARAAIRPTSIEPAVDATEYTTVTHSEDQKPGAVRTATTLSSVKDPVRARSTIVASEVSWNARTTFQTMGTRMTAQMMTAVGPIMVRPSRFSRRVVLETRAGGTGGAGGGSG